MTALPLPRSPDVRHCKDMIRLNQPTVQTSFCLRLAVRRPHPYRCWQQIMVTSAVVSSTCHLGHSYHIALVILTTGILGSPHQVIEMKHIRKFKQCLLQALSQQNAQEISALLNFVSYIPPVKSMRFFNI